MASFITEDKAKEIQNSGADFCYCLADTNGPPKSLRRAHEYLHHVIVNGRDNG